MISAYNVNKLRNDTLNLFSIMDVDTLNCKQVMNKLLLKVASLPYSKSS